MVIIINEKKYPTEVMNTPDEKSEGMMGRTELNGCMLFNMGKGVHSFWMKGCLISLDIVFVTNNKITKIYTNCEPPHRNQLTPKSYIGIGDHVIEFNSGESSNFKVGDRVIFNNN